MQLQWIFNKMQNQWMVKAYHPSNEEQILLKHLDTHKNGSLKISTNTTDIRAISQELVYQHSNGI